MPLCLEQPRDGAGGGGGGCSGKHPQYGSVSLLLPRVKAGRDQGSFLPESKLRPRVSRELPKVIQR